MSEQIKSGIYVITNTETGDCYIGSSVHINKRLTQHRIMLRLGSHHSKLLQAAWHQYGEDAFVFDILESVPDVNKLITIEQQYLDERQPQYNPAKIALRNGAGIVSDPAQLAAAREAASWARITEGEYFVSLHQEIARLRRIITRGDDIMQVLHMIGRLSHLEISTIQQFAKLGMLVYEKGMISGKDFFALIDKIVSGLYDGNANINVFASKDETVQEWMHRMQPSILGVMILGVVLTEADISQMDHPTNQDMWGASYSAGREIRELLMKHGVVPEDMPPEPHISEAKRLASGQLPLLPPEPPTLDVPNEDDDGDKQD